MLQNKDKVLVGVSGGADSVCLLFVLLECAGRMDLSLAVVHVNHGIRPDASEDAAYVESLCKEIGVPFYLVMADARAEAAKYGISEEEAGRNIRYRAFAEKAARFGAAKIAVAHNSNDRAETMLFHLFRGTDIKGLGSIRPVRDNIIRPILCLERREIEEYLSERKIGFCRDSTNAEDDYTRNRIRHHILPYAEQEIAGECVAHMTRTAEVLAETEDYLQIQTTEALERCVESYQENAVTVDVTKLLNEHTLLQKRVLYQLIGILSGTKKDISGVHISELMELIHREGNRNVSLPYGIIAGRSYGKLYLQKKSLSVPAMEKDRKLPHVNSRVGTCEEILGCTAEEWLDKGNFCQKDCTKYFDYDKIKKPPVLRTRRTGDYLTIADENGQIRHKSLKEYMITAKIPAAYRDQIPVLAEEDHVIWLVGYRISEYYKITRRTKYVYQVELIEDCPSGGGTEDKNG